MSDAGRYSHNPAAIQALVREDAVHRDVYTNQEIFDLEMSRLWRNTWLYVGHDSQIPAPGDYYSTEIARQLADGSGPGPRADESLRAQGCAAGQCDAWTLRGRVVALPLSRLDVSARWNDSHDPDARRL